MSYCWLKNKFLNVIWKNGITNEYDEDWLIRLLRLTYNKYPDPIVKIVYKDLDLI